MHPDIAYQLADHRRAELIAEAAHQRLVRRPGRLAAGEAAGITPPAAGCGFCSRGTPSLGVRSMPRNVK
jgi:hypothetical protein